MVEIAGVRVDVHGMTESRDYGPTARRIVKDGFVFRYISEEIRVAFCRAERALV